MKRILLLNLIIIFSTVMLAQNNDLQKINSVSGVGYDENLEIARQKALNDAKKNALTKAGIEENINSFTDLFKSETDNSYQELFTSQIFTEIKGAVKNVKIIDEDKSFSEGDNIKVVIEISCEVIKYNTETDPHFVALIENLNSFYYVGDFLKFDITLNMDAYLKIFCIPQQENDAYFLFPNDYEPSFKLIAGKKYPFPLSINFELALDGDAEQQTDRLIFVFTKEDYPYVGKINYKNIIDWIFSIPPDKRSVNSFSYSIVKR